MKRNNKIHSKRNSKSKLYTIVWNNYYKTLKIAYEQSLKHTQFSKKYILYNNVSLAIPSAAPANF